MPSAVLTGKNYKIIGLTLFLIALAPRLWLALGDLRSPYSCQHDDAFYYYRIAWNIVHGDGISFTKEINTNGFHPLWLMMIIPFFLFFSGFSLQTPVHLAGALCALSSAIAMVIAFFFLRWLFPKISPYILAVPIAIFSLDVYQIVNHICGMETVFASVPFIILLWTHYKLMGMKTPTFNKTFLLWTVANIVVLWIRIDYSILPMLLILHLWWRWRSRNVIGVGMLIGASILPWLVWNISNFGTLIPISGLAFPFLRKSYFLWKNPEGFFTPAGLKYTWTVANVEYLPEALHFAGGGVAGLVIFVLSVLWWIFHKKSKILNTAWFPFILWFLLYSFIQVVLRWYPRGYYFIPAQIIMFLFLLYLIIDSSNSLHKKTISAIGGTILIFIFVLWAKRDLKDLPVSLRKPLREVYAIEQLKQLPSNSVIGMFNAGRVGYYMPDRTVVNLDGAVNPNAYDAFSHGKLWKYIKETKIDFVVDNPFYIFSLSAPVMGDSLYFRYLFPTMYFQDVGVLGNDMGVFSVVDSVTESHIEWFKKSTLINTRAVNYLSYSLQGWRRAS